MTKVRCLVPSVNAGGKMLYKGDEGEIENPATLGYLTDKGYVEIIEAEESVAEEEKPKRKTRAKKDS